MKKFRKPKNPFKRGKKQQTQASADQAQMITDINNIIEGKPLPDCLLVLANIMGSLLGQLVTKVGAGNPIKPFSGYTNVIWENMQKTILRINGTEKEKPVADDNVSTGKPLDTTSTEQAPNLEGSQKNSD